VHPAPDTSKYFYLTEEKMQIAAPRIEPQFGETLIVEGIFPSSIIIITPLFLAPLLILFGYNDCRRY